MKFHHNRLFEIAAALALAAAICIGVPATASAQPPAQGPPSPSPNAQQLGVSLITSTLKNIIEKKVAEENAALTYTKCITLSPPFPNVPYCFQAHKAIITPSLQSYSPWMTQTQYRDRPNQRITLISYIATYDVHDIENYPFSRTISQSIDLQVSCEQWYTGNGTLTVTAIAQPAYLEGDHSFLEDAVGFLLTSAIPDYVDNQIRQALHSFPSGITSNTTPFACSTLGLTPGADPSIRFDAPARRVIIGLLTPQITVQVMQVRRLTTRDLNGNSVYYPVEYPNLELYAGNSSIHLDLPAMVEGQVFVPASNAVVQTPAPPDTGQLVLIGNITYDNNGIEDTGFIVFGKNSNFGNGTQTLTPPKTWSGPSPLKGGKPVWYRSGGYEVLLKINSPLPINALPLFP